MILIGLAGKPGSGRDKIARHLVTAHDFMQYRMREPIRAMLYNALYLPHNSWADKAWRETPPTPGMPSPEAMAETLRDWGIACHPNFWIYSAAQRLKLVNISPPPQGIVISDITSDTEAAWVRANHGLIWHVGTEQQVPWNIGTDVGVDVVQSVDSLMRDYAHGLAVPASA
jgi:hypothetical protein